MQTARVTITLPTELLHDIDREERNRSRFILGAVRRELEWRKREQLRLSLQHPHADSADMERLGLADYAQGLGQEDDDLVLPGAGQPIRWIPGEGWVAVE